MTDESHQRTKVVARVSSEEEAAIIAGYLENAGVRAWVTGGVSRPAFVELANFVQVDVLESDFARAVEMLAEVVPSFARCPSCRYDLSGHAGKIRLRCPECGRLLVAGAEDERPSNEERPCPQCGEVVPGNFDVCWSCGASCDGAEA